MIDGTATIAPTSAAILFNAPEWPSLLAEYEAEVRLEGMPPCDARFEHYAAFEGNGFLHSFDARVNGQIVGFIAVMGTVVPHYSRLVCVTESFFVSKPFRSYLVGLKLLAAAEDKARELGSPGLLVSAPFGGNLWELLPKLKYRESNRVFFKLLAPVESRVAA